MSKNFPHHARELEKYHHNLFLLQALYVTYVNLKKRLKEGRDWFIAHNKYTHTMCKYIRKQTTKAIKTLTRSRAIFVIGVSIPFVAAQNSAPSLIITPPEMNDPARLACPSCSKTPDSITNFIGMTYQALGILDTSNPANTVVWWYKIYGPRQWWIYGAFQNGLAPYPSIVEEVVGGTLRNIDRQQSSARSIAIVLGLYGRDILTDGARGLAVIAQPWPIVRDYQKLLDIDTLIADKLFDLGQAGGLQKKLTNEARQSLIQIFASQQWDDKLFESKTASITIESHATPYTIIQLLLRINRRMKNMVTAGRDPRDTDIAIKNNAISVQINPWFWTGIQTEYACTRLSHNACTQQWKDFTNDIAMITTGFIDTWPKQAREKIKTSLTRLKTLWQDRAWNDENISDKNRADYDARQDELLSAMWLTKHIANISSWIIDISASLPRDFDTMKQTVKDSSQWIASYRSAITQRPTTSPDTIINQIYQVDSKGTQQTDEPGVVWSIMSRLGWDRSPAQTPRQANIISSLHEIETYHHSAMSEQAIASTDDSQLLLANLLASIRYSKATLYNPSNKKTIYENVVRVCETQCSNLWWTCRLP